jgi:putative endopeptidase
MDISKKKTYVLNDYKGPRPLLNDDFYGWMNHRWINSNSIPDDDIRYTHFIETQIEINSKLKKILESDVLPLGTILYNSYLNKSYKNTKCLDELKEILKIVDMINTYEDLITVATRLLFINVNTLFSVSVDANIYSSCNNILYMAQPSLGLPDRAYYHDNKYNNIRQNYYDTICKIYKEIYPKTPDSSINYMASLVLSIEKELAIIFLSSSDRRDSESVYHQIELEAAIKKYPKLHIDSIIQILCLLSDDLIIEQNFLNIIMEHQKDPEKNYFKQLEKLISGHTIEEWKEFYRFKILLKYINLTNQNMRDTHFNMFKKTLRGQKNPKPEWKSALSLTCAMLVDPISRIYVHNYFTSNMESYIKEMVKNIKLATKERIKKLEWMSDKTKQRALLKLHRMKLKIGYSKSQPRNYDHIVLTNSIIKNIIILNRDNMINNLNKVNHTVDPDDWDLPAYIVNAYFNPTRNEIIFPASILQSPFFDITKSDIYNYGHIGSVIGHEIIHGFDDQGSKFDESGTINDWWTDADKDNYNKKVQHIIKLYNNEGINGKLTAGENIADFGAVVMPLHALKYKLKRDLTEDDIREFYASYANHWQYLLRPEAADERLLSDPHAFADLRVNIPLKNQILFQKVYMIKKGDRMFLDPKDILTIW